MDQTNVIRPAQLPDTYYYGIRPTISKVAAEMDDMSVAYPTQGMFDSMLDRVYDDVSKMYPEEMQMQGTFEESKALNTQATYHTDQVFGPFRRRRFVRDILGVLLLAELLDRRGRRHW